MEISTKYKLSRNDTVFTGENCITDMFTIFFVSATKTVERKTVYHKNTKTAQLMQLRTR